MEVSFGGRVALDFLERTVKAIMVWDYYSKATTTSYACGNPSQVLSLFSSLSHAFMTVLEIVFSYRKTCGLMIIHWCTLFPRIFNLSNSHDGVIAALASASPSGTS